MHHRYHAPVRARQPLGNQSENMLLVFQIQMIRWFIQNQKTGVLGKHLGQKRALQLAAGQVQNAFFTHVQHAGKPECFLHGLLSVLSAAFEKTLPVSITSQTHNFFHGIAVLCPVVLGQHTDQPCTLHALHFTQVLPVQAQASLPGHGLGNGTDQRAFSGSIGAGQHEPLPLRKIKRDVLNRPRIAVMHIDMPGFQHHRRPFLVR